MASKLKKAENLAWTAASKYFRTRDCLATTGNPVVGACFTCDKRLHISELDAGHFVSRKAKQIMFDEHNIHAQCRRCNRFLDANIHEYYPRMVKKYGKAEVNRLVKARWDSQPYSYAELAAIREDFKSKLKELQSGTD